MFPLTVHFLTFGSFGSATAASMYVRTAPGAEHRAGKLDPSGWVKCGAFAPRTVDRAMTELTVALDPPIAVAPGETRAIHIHSVGYIYCSGSPCERGHAEVHGPLALGVGRCTNTAFLIHPAGTTSNNRGLVGGVGYSAAATHAELPEVPNTSMLLAAERRSWGEWIAEATSDCATNRKAADAVRRHQHVSGRREQERPRGFRRASPAFQAAAPSQTRPRCTPRTSRPRGPWTRPSSRSRTRRWPRP